VEIVTSVVEVVVTVTTLDVVVVSSGRLVVVLVSVVLVLGEVGDVEVVELVEGAIELLVLDEVLDVDVGGGVVVVEVGTPGPHAQRLVTTSSGCPLGASSESYCASFCDGVSIAKQRTPSRMASETSKSTTCPAATPSGALERTVGSKGGSGRVFHVSVVSSQSQALAWTRPPWLLAETEWSGTVRRRSASPTDAAEPSTRTFRYTCFAWPPPSTWRRSLV
jgi:hypothetical protein